MAATLQTGTVATAVLTLVLIAASARTRIAAQGPGSPVRSVVDGVFTSAQASRGRQQFQQTCTACHSASEHTGRKFETKWQGTTLGDFFELVSTTMPQSDPGSLTPEDYASIVAFLLSETGYKEGGTELPFDLESLKNVRIEPVPR